MLVRTGHLFAGEPHHLLCKLKFLGVPLICCVFIPRLGWKDSDGGAGRAVCALRRCSAAQQLMVHVCRYKAAHLRRGGAGKRAWQPSGSLQDIVTKNQLQWRLQVELFLQLL